MIEFIQFYLQLMGAFYLITIVVDTFKILKNKHNIKKATKNLEEKEVDNLRKQISYLEKQVDLYKESNQSKGAIK